jgi:hypothetical protein
MGSERRNFLVASHCARPDTPQIGNRKPLAKVRITCGESRCQGLAEEKPDQIYSPCATRMDENDSSEAYSLGKPSSPWSLRFGVFSPLLHVGVLESAVVPRLISSPGDGPGCKSSA